MGGDTLRHVVSRRVHLERAQPNGRKHLGLLEKHKDYVLRAQDFHKKEKKLQLLREKTIARNPDEFYFKMISSRLDDKGHYHVVEKPKTAKELLQETQKNQKLVDWKHSIALGLLNKKEKELHHIGLTNEASHIFFVDDEKEKHFFEKEKMHENNLDCQTSVLEETSRLGVELMKQKFNKLSETKALKQAADLSSELIKSALNEYIEKEKYVQNLHMLKTAREKLENKYHLSKKNNVRKVKGSDGVRNIYKWEARRLR